MRSLWFVIAIALFATAASTLSCTSAPTLNSDQAKSPLRALSSDPRISPDSYIGHLIESFEIVGFWTMLSRMTVNDPSPWTRYDEPGRRPGLEMWRIARTAPLVDHAHPERTSLEILHGILMEHEETFRDHPVVGGGDEQVDGPEVQGFYVVTESQKLALEKNPLLTLTFRNGRTGPGGAQLWYAKHEYPCARTYRKFSSELEPSLVAELETAERTGRLSDANSDEFKNLTRKLIGYLVRTTLDRSDLSATARYQRLMSIHPFGDFNGRSLRMFYQRETGKPLFLKIWDWDLFMQPEEFAQAVEKGDAELAEIREGFLQEQARDPAFPKYYESAAPWKVASGLSQSDPRRARARDILFPLFRDNPSLKDALRRKSHLEILDLIQKYLNN